MIKIISEFESKEIIDNLEKLIRILEVKLGPFFSPVTIIGGYHESGIGFVTINSEDKIIDQDMKPISQDIYEKLKKGNKESAIIYMATLFNNRNFGLK